MSVRPRIYFICEKHSKPRGNLAASASVYFKGQRPAIVTSGAGRHGWLASNSDTARAVCVWGGAVRTRVCVCVCVCVCASVMCLQYYIGSFHVKSSGDFHGPPPIILKFGTLVGIV